jgi:hypothetical protein
MVRLLHIKPQLKSHLIYDLSPPMISIDKHHRLNEFVHLSRAQSIFRPLFCCSRGEVQWVGRSLRRRFGFFCFYAYYPANPVVPASCQCKSLYIAQHTSSPLGHLKNNAIGYPPLLHGRKTAGTADIVQTDELVVRTPSNNQGFVSPPPREQTSIAQT